MASFFKSDKDNFIVACQSRHVSNRYTGFNPFQFIKINYELSNHETYNWFKENYFREELETPAGVETPPPIEEEFTTPIQQVEEPAEVKADDFAVIGVKEILEKEILEDEYIVNEIFPVGICSLIGHIGYFHDDHAHTVRGLAVHPVTQVLYGIASGPSSLWIVSTEAPSVPPSSRRWRTSASGTSSATGMRALCVRT